MAEKKLTKEQANALYDDLHRAMKVRMGGREGLDAALAAVRPATKAASTPHATTASAAQTVGKLSYSKAAATTSDRNDADSGAASQRGRSTVRGASERPRSGQVLALMVLVVLGSAKITLSAIEASGVARVEEAKAVVMPVQTGPRWSKEEAKILTALDARRVELEERGDRLEKREGEIVSKERELAVRLTELKELSERLKLEREKGDKQRDTQLDQLANVYGSMNPPEAAHLLEQLDIQVALSLVERMPEKRMAQILSLMNAQRALELTNLLTSRTRPTERR